MITWVENYGEDIDGNRGVEMHFYDIEDGDKYEITEQIKACLEQEPELKAMTVTLVCPVTQAKVDFEVNVKDYL